MVHPLISEKTLLAAWLGDEPARVISTRLGVDQKYLYRRWQRLKEKQMIPPDGRRDIDRDQATLARRPARGVPLADDSAEALRLRKLERADNEMLRRLGLHHPERRTVS